MRIQIEVDDTLSEDEIIIRCRSLNEEIQNVQKAVADAASKSQKFIFYKGDTEYYLSLEKILFFETDGSGISAHTIDDVYETKYKLYELEEILPGHFMRVSKSSILNLNQIYSINRNLSAASVVEFQNTHKQVYVSRSYYKPLKCKLEEKRIRG